MTFKTSHLIVLCIIGLAIANGENVRGSISRSNEIRSERSAFHNRIRQNRDQARQAQQLSKVALERYRSNCIMVVDTQTNQESYFEQGDPVFDHTGSKTALRDGAYICNSLGDTAIVQDGKITDIARVTTQDLAEFQSLLSSRL